jgi:hypothetical protein
MSLEADLSNSYETEYLERLVIIEEKLDQVLEFVTALKSGIGNAQNSGGPMAMMARGMLPDFTQG